MTRCDSPGVARGGYSPGGARGVFVAMHPRVLARGALQVLLLVVLLMLLGILFNSNHHAQVAPHNDTSQQSAKRHRVSEQIRLRKLRELQQNVFRMVSRPSDENYNMNITLSEKLPLERALPDTRPALCRDIQYDVTALPTLSVVIPVYQEALSMLLRTVHSILMRTPPSLLSNIILVDDWSTNPDLKEPLERYVSLLPKVQLVRTSQREGLIRARLIGARLATGDVLVFQDGHTENNVGWAEPLLEEIRKNPHTVIQPNVDSVDPKDLVYTATSGLVPRGGFTWDLRYVWMEMPEHERSRLQSEADPHRTATLVGCVMAVRKDYFIHIGAFDDGMNIWGGENIELGFRTWMCGGQVLSHPCSRVAHVFKPFSYKFDGDREQIVQKNQMRIAELWMDDWRKFFYASTYSWPKKRVKFTREDMESLAERKTLKKRLGCRGFDWFMKEIIPEMPKPSYLAVFHGEVANLRSEACLQKLSDGFVGMTYFCFFHRILPENTFHIDYEGRFWFGDNHCVLLDQTTLLLKVGECSHKARDVKWDTVSVSKDTDVPYEVIVRMNYGSKKDRRRLCMTQVTNVNQVHKKDQMPQMLACEDDNRFQHWRFSYKFDFTYDFGLFDS